MYTLLRYCRANGCTLEDLAVGVESSSGWAAATAGSAKISLTGFTDEVTIHQVGKMNGTASTQSSAVETQPSPEGTDHDSWNTHLRRNCHCSDGQRTRRSRTAATDRVAP